MTIDRRNLVKAAVAGAAVAFAGGNAGAASGIAPGAVDPGDEAYWSRVAAQYDVVKDVIQLENGNWGMMARPVLAAYREQLARVNRESSFYARRGMGKDMAALHDRVAAMLKVAPEELVFTRNATEALKALIGGYNRLQPGDAVLYADLDYDSMQASLVASARRRGARAVRIDLPEPATRESVIAAYDAAFDADPKIRMVLLTHLSHRTGLVIPVREIVARARARGIDAIVDAAHSWGQLDFAPGDLGADFIGLNLHKWIGAPLGVGAMVIRKGRLDAIDRDIAEDAAGDTVAARVHTGTVDYAALLTVPAALDFVESVGMANRAARLRYLRDRWVRAVRSLPGVEVLTPDDARMHGSITSFRLAGRGSAEENAALAKTLVDRFGIFTVLRTGVAKGACIRATPALFNGPADVDALAKALAVLAGEARG
ncbi:MAG: aminotransferase class V-fold PLP-dependent enzyme [Pseudomonadota bacterium]